MMPQRHRMLASIALIAIWLGLVLAGLTPVQEFVSMVRDALVALGIYHAALKNPRDKP